MSVVKISSEGLLLYKYEDGIYIKDIIEESCILSYLRNDCEIVENTTLGDIFKIVKNNDMLKSFIKQYSWCGSIDEFHDQSLMHPDDDFEYLDRLVIEWSSSTNLTSKKSKNLNGLRIITKVIGFDLSPDFYGFDSNGTACSVSATPMWQLANVPVELDENYEIYEPFCVSGSREKLIVGSRRFTLLNILDAIYYDISFYGGPNNLI